MGYDTSMTGWQNTTMPSVDTRVGVFGMLLFRARNGFPFTNCHLHAY